MSASTRRPLWQPLTAVAAVLVMALAVVLVVIASTSDDEAPAATASATSAAPNGQPERVAMRPVALDGMREADPGAQGPGLLQAPADADDTAPAGLRAQMSEVDCAADRGPAARDEYLVTCDEDGATVYLLEPAVFDGSAVQSAEAARTAAGAWVVSVTLTPDGSDVWADYTGRNIGRSTALVLDSTVLSVASIQSRIGGTMDLSGEFTEQEAKALAKAFTGDR
ncbi:SecDF P1 head subdomain-containing protein [Gordonia alkaliphila]|uniref:SecDF P1 head subdomain domain-containing protein n=1 Tax=Gordonia alkaliphila TaxID=1053547 RepID=A0ABP8YYQ9_9ACTN